MSFKVCLLMWAIHFNPRVIICSSHPLIITLLSFDTHTPSIYIYITRTYTHSDRFIFIQFDDYHSIFSTYIRTHMAWIIIRTFYLTSIYHTPFHNPSKSTNTLLYSNKLACLIFPVRKMDKSNNRITYRLFGLKKFTYRLLFL